MSNAFKQGIVASVVDEAHLVEEWGREFRPDYGKLVQLASLFPNASFLDLTATAPKHIQEALINCGHLNSPRAIVANLNRPNIFWRKGKKGCHHQQVKKVTNPYMKKHTSKDKNFRQ